ncbi:hypothetical protein [Porphyromonas sp. COT-290 OH3588]|uniref:flavodoxin family protein n=1 Tax=Porphyromonas sp. COT-290 OH3588 TaxID=1515617 RepID=UPI00052D5CA6|nr:hypothetical protein [Porphyromonas sp. COT-290 OH3588]KGO00893.1 hypothetical protein HQ48_05250 [Porphyromonas sp. COT-290 OH3588]
MKATIIYHSRRGRTAGYAREIAMHLWTQGVSVKCCATADFKPEMLDECDLLLLGCWTSGWFVINQYPNHRWVTFAKQLPSQLPKHLLLFSTYKFRTGSMFRGMKKHLNLRDVGQIATLQSKTGFLSPEDKRLLDQYVAQIRQQQ